MSSYTLVIPGRLPSLNDVIQANRKKNYVGARQKLETENMIFAYIRQQLQHLVIDKPIWVSVVWYEPTKARDIDNVIGGGTKFLMDALVVAEVIANDNQRWVKGYTHDVLIDRDNPRVEITLTEVEE